MWFIAIRCRSESSASPERARRAASRAETFAVLRAMVLNPIVRHRGQLSVARTVRYVCNVVGPEHVALGSDSDGATTVPFDATGLPKITGALLEEGVTREKAALIMGQNALRFLEENLPETPGESE